VSDLHARLLERAVEILGSRDEVAAYLGVSPSHLRIWMDGMFSPPTEVFLKLVDLVSEPPALNAGTRSAANWRRQR
jgi:DNA-binding transcriptional regulator YiaG